MVTKSRPWSALWNCAWKLNFYLRRRIRGAIRPTTWWRWNNQQVKLVTRWSCLRGIWPVVSAVSRSRPPWHRLAISLRSRPRIETLQERDIFWSTRSLIRYSNQSFFVPGITFQYTPDCLQVLSLKKCAYIFKQEYSLLISVQMADFG